MSHSFEVCNGHQDCTSEVLYACNCSNPVVFLCKSCVLEHLSEPSPHLFISLEQARELMKDISFNQRFHENFGKYNIIYASIQGYISKLDSYIKDLVKARAEIMSLIEREFQEKIDLLSDIQRNAVAQLEIIKKRTKTLISTSDDVLGIYEEKGLKGLFEDYVESFDINTNAIQDDIKKMCMISRNNIIYYTKPGTSQLITYDISTNQTVSFDFGQFISNGFNFSSTCLLPDGDVMIVGRFNHTTGDTYRFNPKTRECTKLNPLINHRGSAGLIYHDRYLYAFGGSINSPFRHTPFGASPNSQPSSKAERMDLGCNVWGNLPDMKEARVYHGIIGMKNRIYLIGGGTNTVEFYNTLDNTFNIVPNVQVPNGMINSVLIDDRIYLINQSQLIILSKEFNVLETKPMNFIKEIDSINNKVIVGKKVYFYSSNPEFIFAFDSEKNSLNEVTPVSFSIVQQSQAPGSPVGGQLFATR